MAPPTAHVLDAFGANGTPQRLAGGQGDAYLAGGIVLKPVDDPAEARWTAELLTRVRPDGFRISEPVPTSAGRWVHDGWAASRYIPGLRDLAPRWDDVIAAGMRFCDAAERARRDDGGVLVARTHRWAVADRVAWGEQDIALDPATAALLDELSAGFGDAVGRPQFVHGDLAGNVFLDEDGTPVILDVSPYLRPRPWAAAVVVGDALLWHGAGADLAETLDDRGLLMRALAFRLVADALAAAPGQPPPLDGYRRVLAALR